MSSAGDRIAGRYELRAMAGEGGMATVWRAIMHGAASFTRVVAIKEIKREFGAIKSYIDMFIEEARVGSDLAHPDIVQVYDFIEDDGTFFLVMEWVEGVDLEDFVLSYKRQKQHVPWPLVAAIGIHALRGLGAAHSRRRLDGAEAPVIHRDVSPNNVLLSTGGQIKITDFGLARARDRVYSLTAPGTVKGKLSYLAPEVTYGKPATPQSDLFSLGSVLWEALVGRRLFDAPDDISIFRAIRRCEVPALAELRPDIPAPLAETIHRALSLEVGERYATAEDMAAQMSEAFTDTRFSPWRVSDELGRAVQAVREKRSRLPLPADDAATPTKPKPDAANDAAQTGPQDLFRNRAVAVQFVEYSDSDSITVPDYQPDGSGPAEAQGFGDEQTRTDPGSSSGHEGEPDREHE